MPQKNDWQFYLWSNQAWDAMYRDCARATESIEVEQYIIENDALGQKFLKLFAKKAAEGVKVLVICDKFGSSRLYLSPLVRKLRRSGGRFCFYNPIKGWNILTPWRWFPRTHIKMMLIDSRIGYIGGVCIAERMHGWRDTEARLNGPVTAQLRGRFDAVWANLPYYSFKNWQPEKKRGPFYLVQNHPRKQRHVIYRELLAAVARAEKQIAIATAFFVPDRRFLAVIKRMREKGVEVNILVPEFSDVPLADWVCLTYARRLMKEGVRIYHYQGTVMHSKIVIVDDDWATLGSTNMDVLSFFHNYESNLIITEKKAVMELKSHFKADCKASLELTEERWAKIPVSRKIMGYMGRILRMFF